MIPRILLGIVFFLALASPAFAKLIVVATLPWIGSLAQDIGKDKVHVITLVKPTQDVHSVEPKPSMILEVRRADILMINGLELEADFLRALVESSRNPKVQPGSAGYFDCSQFVEAIDRPAMVDRSMGEVYPLGNPHYHFSPKNVLRVAAGITGILSRVDWANGDSYQKNFASFQERFNERQKQWSGKPLKGKIFLSYDKFFEYLAEEFGFEILGYIEPKPGIPPSAGHMEKLIAMMKQTKPDALLTTAFEGEEEVNFLSQKTGVRSIILPHDVGATVEAKDWFSFMDQVLDTLK